MRMIIVLCWLIGTPSAALAFAPADSIKWCAQADSMISARIDTLEARWQIRFDPALRPGFRLGLPTELPADSRWMYSGVYRTDSMTISLPPPARSIPLVPWLCDVVIDHELIHAYADQQSRHRGDGPWPSVARVDTTSLADVMALRLIVEGIAEATTSIIPFDESVPLKKWLPKTPKQMAMSGFGAIMWTYCGGRALIQPLLDHAGLERTVEYVQTHPVEVRGRNFRAALIRWHVQARIDLGVPSP